jgi:acetyl esterase
LILVGTADPLIDGNRAFARRLGEPGNADVTLYAAVDMEHGYYFFPGLLLEEDQVFQEIARFLRRALQISEG